MKYLIGLVSLSLLAALVRCEDCSDTSDCVVTQCAGGNAVVCELPASGGTGKCTCAVPEACIVREDCYSPAHEELNCPDEQRHCYDSSCICSMFGGDGVIGGGFPGFPGK